MKTASLDKKALPLVSQAIRVLSMDAIEKAKSGHPGLPLGCAELGAVLYGRLLAHNPKNPDWANRDRFVLSAGHGSMFTYSLLHLFGYGLTVDEIKRFRQTGSKTPGHPEFGLTAGVETSTGPLGAGFATAVGLAMAEAHLASVFNTATHKPVDHFTWVLAGDGCLMEGVSAEAASLAGHLGLGKLIVFYDSNRITIEGSTDVAFTEKVGERFTAYGWQVLEGDAYDTDGIESLAQKAKSETAKPSLIILKSTIGKGAPNKAGSHEVHGAPLGDAEIKAAKEAMGLDPAQAFTVPSSLDPFMKQFFSSCEQDEASWNTLFADWKKANSDKAKLWDEYFSPTTKQNIEWPVWKAGDSVATRSAGGACLQAIAKAIPGFIGGSADLAPSNNTDLKGLGHFQKGSYQGRNLHYGVREHAMGNIVNGLVLHGGLKAFGATFMVFSDYLKPAIRLAALMGIPSNFIFTHDSIWVGEDGPTHQPIEQIEMLRSIPGLEVLRPSDAEETAYCWELMLAKTTGAACHGQANIDLAPNEGPSAILLTRQNLVVQTKPSDWKQSVKSYGAYLAYSTSENAKLTIISTGSEVGTSIETAKILATKGIQTRVFSVPSQERLLHALDSKTLPTAWKLEAAINENSAFCIEAGSPRSWTCLVPRNRSIGIKGFGRSGQGKEIAELMSLDAASLAKTIEATLAK